MIGFSKQSDGDVRVVTRLGQGTTFTLYLPRAQSPTGPVDAIRQPHRPSHGDGLCVLAVEDNPDVGTFATQALKELGQGGGRGLELV